MTENSNEGRRWHTITLIRRPNRTLHIFDYVPCVDDDERLAWHHRLVVRHGHHDNEWMKLASEEIWRPGMPILDYARAMEKKRPGVRHPIPETFNHTPLDRIEGRGRSTTALRLQALS